MGYNLSALPLAAAGLLDPLVAALAMGLSSLIVVLNSLRLTRARPAGTRRDPAAAGPPRPCGGSVASVALPVVLFAGVTV